MEDYGPSAFQEYFEAEIMDKEITAIEKDSNGKVDTEAIDKILEDETIEERAAARTKKIKDVWDQIP